LAENDKRLDRKEYFSDSPEALEAFQKAKESHLTDFPWVAPRENRRESGTEKKRRPAARFF
jgi:hypothetical protein